ncbi:MAG: allantoicase [Actinomycetota bacterium]|nr:allantoicase [Actinomycetota bacterium]
MPHFTDLTDLASRTLAGSVVSANDELFAERENLIRAEAPTHAVDEFGHKGKVYDGWETRRRREAGHDWAIVRLGAAGVVHGVVVDTAYFTGNYPPEISVEATSVEGYPSAEELSATSWESLVDKSAALGNTANEYPVDNPGRWTHVRLSIHPDGGVARFRVHGVVVPDPRFLRGTVDLAALENGGRLVETSDAFYSSPRNLILPGRARSMADGWENARRRGGGNDYAVFALAVRGHLRDIEVDTSYFVGNAPGWVAVRAAEQTAGPIEDESAWWDAVPRTRVQPDTRHRFLVDQPTPATHIRLDVYPDGGLARLRCNGEIEDDAWAELHQRWWDSLPDSHRKTVDSNHPA